MKIQIWGFWHASKSQYMLSWAEALDVTFAFINRRVSYSGFLWLHGILFCLLKLLVCKLVLWEIVSFAKSLECLVELMIPICSHQVTILRIGLSSRSNSGKGKDLNHGKKNSADTHKKAAEKELPSSLMNKWFNRGRQCWEGFISGTWWKNLLLCRTALIRIYSSILPLLRVRFLGEV